MSFRGRKLSPEAIEKIRAAKLGWCHAEALDLYRQLARKVGAAEARRAVLDHVRRAR
jgi:hypothetical protein